jgi:hypothetical protein
LLARTIRVGVIVLMLKSTALFFFLPGTAVALALFFIVALLVSRFLLQHGHSATPFHCLGIRQLELESHALVEIHLTRDGGV